MDDTLGQKHLCDVCGMSFSRRDYLKEHRRIRHEGQKYECKICNKMFTFQSNFSRHKLKHKVEANICCDICGSVFKNKDDVKQHKRQLHKHQLTCQYCGKTFAQKCSLRRHIKTHTSQITLACVCGKEFSRQDNFVRHKQMCASITSQQETSAGEPSNKKDTKFSCVCGNDYVFKSGLTRHQKNCKPSLVRQSKKKETKEKRPSTRNSLGKNSEKICHQCGQSFTKTYNYSRHMLIHSDSRPMYSCQKCLKSWKRKDKYDHHKCKTDILLPSPMTSNEKHKNRKLRKKAESVLKSSPKSKANFIKSALNSPSKNTRKLLEQEGLIQTKESRKQRAAEGVIFAEAEAALGAIKHRRSTNSSRLRQHTAAILLGDKAKQARVTSTVSKKLHIAKTARRVDAAGLRNDIIGDDAALADVIRKARGEKIPDDWKKLVSDYWTKEASHVTTDSWRREVRSRIGVKQFLVHDRHIMTKSYREAYRDFTKRYPEVTVSETSFRRLKPFYVRPATSRDLEQCCCQRCVSVRKAFRGLMNFRQRQNKTSNSNLKIYNDVYSLVKDTLCDKKEGNEFHDMECLSQECPNCGIDKLEFKDIELSSDVITTWYKFEIQTFVTKDGKKTNHLGLEKKNTKPVELIKHLCDQLNGYSLHLFTARWQRVHWAKLIESLPADHAAIEMDFSENYSCLVQEEAQSMHWGKTQCTIHSCVLWRPSVSTDNTEDNHVKEHWLFISDDLTHDHRFVDLCLTDFVMPKLIELGCTITTLHQRTDGAGSQYKSKHSFGDISRSQQDLKVKRVANFSASGHGKGEVDAAAGFVKTETRKAVITDVNLTITDAKSLFQFAESNLANRPIQPGKTLHKRRFFFVPKESVIQHREKERQQYTTVKDTRQLHSFASENTDGKIKTRNLTCYCVPCIQENYDQCEHKSHVKNFSSVLFGESVSDSDSEESDRDLGDDGQDTLILDDSTATCNIITDMICQDSTIAIKPSSDSNREYFLFHVISDGVIQLTDTICASEYGHTYYAGEQVIKGYYYSYEKTTRGGCLYKRLTKEAIVPKASVLYVGIDLQQHPKHQHLYLLKPEDECDIICSISSNIMD